MIALSLFLVAFILILRGVSVAYALGGASAIFYVIGVAMGVVSPSVMEIAPERIFGLMSNPLLLAIPFFILMGNILQESGLSKKMLESSGASLGSLRGGLGIMVILIGTAFAAATSVVAASVSSMTTISLKQMLQNNYSKEYATGVIAASGTLGQIIPPSIVLIFIADQMGLSVTGLFKAAVFPGLILCISFILYTIVLGVLYPKSVPPIISSKSQREKTYDTLKYSIPIIFLIICVLGSIFSGIATPTEAGAFGVMSSALISILFTDKVLDKIWIAGKKTLETTSSIMAILIGSTIFAFTFKILGGNEVIYNFLGSVPGEELGFVLFVSLLVFALGFFLDFFEIIFIVIPLILPTAELLEVNTTWLAMLIALNIQTSFLTPPFGFSLFFLKGALPVDLKEEVSITNIYRGIIPFVAIQIVCIAIVFYFPSIVLWAE